MARLEKMALKVSKIGVPGEQTFVRVVNGSTVSKAEELFSSLTKDANNGQYRNIINTNSTLPCD